MTDDYAAKHAAYLERIRLASGARELREYGPKKTRRRRAPGEPLACGCRPEDEEIRDLMRWDNRTGSRFDCWWTRAEDKELWRKMSDHNEAVERKRRWLTQMGADNPGFPDILCRGLPPVLLEMKAKCLKHKCSRVQLWKHGELRASGWIVLVANAVDEAVELLEAERRRLRG